MGELEARDARMQEYLGRVKRLQSDFESFNLTYVSRSGNTHADSLATLATSLAHDLPRIILVEDLVQASSIRRDPAQVHQVRKSPSWMDPIMNFLKRYITRGKTRGREDTEECSSILVVGRPQAIPTFLFWAVPIMYTPRGVRVPA